MAALEEFTVTVTLCFTPEHRGVAPHHTSPPREPAEYAEFCARMVRRYGAPAAQHDGCLAPVSHVVSGNDGHGAAPLNNAVARHES
jgi:hypothetical protein